MQTPKFWKPYLIGSGFILTIALAAANGRSKDLNHSVTLPEGFDAPMQVRTIFQRACSDCHSNETVWPWYSKLPLVSWQIRDDVELGRKAMNVSQWSEYTPEERYALASQMVFETRTHLMPPPKYLWLHHEARLSGADLDALKDWALRQSK